MMTEVLKAETKAQLREPEGFSAVEAGGCTDRPHNDPPADRAAQNQRLPVHLPVLLRTSHCFSRKCRNHLGKREKGETVLVLS